MIDVRVGSEVAEVYLDGVPRVPLAAAEDLARAQAACLRLRDCSGLETVPPSLVTALAAPDAGTPIPVAKIAKAASRTADVPFEWTVRL
jgi:hypothetical protein